MDVGLITLYTFAGLFVPMESELIDLKNESNRLGTFAGWPVSFIISPQSLAAAGFYYTKHSDNVMMTLSVA